MSWNLRPTAEKLYLHRGKDENDDIFVQAALHQHHIDGLRFLYKQFKRKKPGVILNNPNGYGNSLQVTLFLGAIQHLLKKPILIICEEGEEYDWLELFQKHTQCYHVVVNASNAFVKKSIFINNMDGVEMFARRPWGAIVVDNEGFLKMKTLHAKFEAEYKIWITSDDIKDQLPTFSVIYKWIFPKEKFNPDDFKAKPGDRKDMISKSILLATFLEDFVFRSKLINPFENPCESNEKTQQKVSEKRKDVTGTKIKRSKRAAETINNTNPDVSATKLPKVNNDNNQNSKKDINTISLSNVGNSDSESVVTNMKDKHSDLDVETFISSQEPIQNHLFNFDNVSYESQENKMVLHYSENNMECDVNAPNCAEVNMLSSLDRTSNRDITMSPGSDGNAYELETQEFLNDNNIEINNIEHMEIKIEEVCPNVENNCHMNENDHDETKSVDAENQNSENKDNGIDKKTEILYKHDKVESKEDVSKDEEITQGSQNIKSNLNNTTVDIDTKISEHEDRITKKFKGTFLDSIF